MSNTSLLIEWVSTSHAEFFITRFKLYVKQDIYVLILFENGKQCDNFCQAFW